MTSKTFGLPCGLLVILALFLGPVQDAAAQRRIIDLTAAQLTAQAAAKFPQRRCLLGLACITMADPIVRLKEGDARIFFTTRASPEIAARPLEGGVIEMAGRPRYDASRGAFFIDAPEVLRMDFADLPVAYRGTATELSRGLLMDYLRQTPVWVLDEHDAHQALARLVLREVEVHNGTLRLIIGDDEEGAAKPDEERGAKP